jgi:hypothetical protein
MKSERSLRDQVARLTSELQTQVLGPANGATNGLSSAAYDELQREQEELLIILGQVELQNADLKKRLAQYEPLDDLL